VAHGGGSCWWALYRYTIATRKVHFVCGIARESPDLVRGIARESSDLVRGIARESPDLVRGIARESSDLVRGIARARSFIATCGLHVSLVRGLLSCSWALYCHMWIARETFANASVYVYRVAKTHRIP